MHALSSFFKHFNKNSKRNLQLWLSRKRANSPRSTFNHRCTYRIYDQKLNESRIIRRDLQYAIFHIYVIFNSARRTIAGPPQMDIYILWTHNSARIAITVANRNSYYAFCLALAGVGMEIVCVCVYVCGGICNAAKKNLASWDGFTTSYGMYMNAWGIMFFRSTRIHHMRFIACMQLLSLLHISMCRYAIIVLCTALHFQ